MIRDWISKNGTFAWMHVIVGSNIIKEGGGSGDTRLIYQLQEINHMKTFRPQTNWFIN